MTTRTFWEEEDGDGAVLARGAVEALTVERGAVVGRSMMAFLGLKAI